MSIIPLENGGDSGEPQGEALIRSFPDRRAENDGGNLDDDLLEKVEEEAVT